MLLIIVENILDFVSYLFYSILVKQFFLFQSQGLEEWDMGIECMCLDEEVGSWVRVRVKVIKLKYIDCIQFNVCCVNVGLLDIGMFMFVVYDFFQVMEQCLRLERRVECELRLESW